MHKSACQSDCVATARPSCPLLPPKQPRAPAALRVDRKPLEHAPLCFPTNPSNLFAFCSPVRLIEISVNKQRYNRWNLRQKISKTARYSSRRYNFVDISNASIPTNYLEIHRTDIEGSIYSSERKE